MITPAGRTRRPPPSSTSATPTITTPGAGCRATTIPAQCRHCSCFIAWGSSPSPGQDVYLIGSPAFARAVVHMENGREVVIVARGVSRENIYIQSATLNGRPLDRAWFRHAEIRQGATLEFEMGPKPSAWGAATPPPSASDGADLPPRIGRLPEPDPGSAVGSRLVPDHLWLRSRSGHEGRPYVHWMGANVSWYIHGPTASFSAGRRRRSPAGLPWPAIAELPREATVVPLGGPSKPR